MSQPTLDGPAFTQAGGTVAVQSQALMSSEDATASTATGDPARASASPIAATRRTHPDARSDAVSVRTQPRFSSAHPHAGTRTTPDGVSTRASTQSRSG